MTGEVSDGDELEDREPGTHVAGELVNPPLDEWTNDWDEQIAAAASSTWAHSLPPLPIEGGPIGGASTARRLSVVSQRDQIRIRMDATGNQAVVSALMTSFAFSLLVTQPPASAPEEFPGVIDHFILSSSIATALSLIVLFQSAMEYQFCLRVLEAYGGDAAFALVKSFRWQRRVGEISFALSIVSFFYAAACWAILQSTNNGNHAVGFWSAGVLAFGCVLVLSMLGSMEALKKKRERLEGGAQKKEMQRSSKGRKTPQQAAATEKEPDAVTDAALHRNSIAGASIFV
jgi:hypothetical protein